MTKNDFYGLYMNERIQLKFGENYGIRLHSIFGREPVEVCLPNRSI